MNDYTVSLFGHRNIDDLRLLDTLLMPLITELIKIKSYVTFLIGRNGEFDEYAASLIKRVQKTVGKENNELNLVLPYSVAKIAYYEGYYDNIIIPQTLHKAHPKAAIKLKNHWMVEQSDLVIVYVERDNGGAYDAMKYAEKNNIPIVNIHNTITDKADD